MRNNTLLGLIVVGAVVGGAFILLRGRPVSSAAASADVLAPTGPNSPFVGGALGTTSSAIDFPDPFHDVLNPSAFGDTIGQYGLVAPNSPPTRFLDSALDAAQPVTRNVGATSAIDLDRASPNNPSTTRVNGGRGDFDTARLQLR